MTKRRRAIDTRPVTSRRVTIPVKREKATIGESVRELPSQIAWSGHDPSRRPGCYPSSGLTLSPGRPVSCQMPTGLFSLAKVGI